jgi:hypothetical protein
MIWGQMRRDVAQSGSALGWGPSGRRFESGRPDFFRGLGRALGNGRTKGFIVLDTLYLLLGIIGFFALIAAFFFGGFVLLDFLFGRFRGDQ